MSPVRLMLTAALLGAPFASTGHARSSASDGILTAEYTVVFDATWSAQTHPFQFPSGAHFSTPIGGTHDATVAFWAVGELASEGIEQMAEQGRTSPLASEVEAQIALGHAGEVIRASSGPSSPGSVSTSFTVTEAFPLATLVTMIAPSPDWFVGVSGLPLRVGGQWVDEIVVPLQPFDAGTDSGTTYTSPNANTSPPEPIFEITGLPFAMPPSPVPPLGTFTFRRVRPADINGDGVVDVLDLLAVLQAWGPCTQCPEDINGDGIVDVLDLLEVLLDWG